MSLETALVTALRAHSGLAALVAQRIYPVRLPQGATLPAVVYQRISTVRESALGRVVAGASVRVQFTVWGATHQAAQDTADQVRLALLAFTAAPVVDMELEGDVHDAEPQTETYRVLVDALITLTGDA